MNLALLSRHCLTVALGGVLLLAAVTCPRAQNATAHVDLTSPRMTEAELTRGQIEAMIAARPPGAVLDLADRSLNGLDLSGLDLGGADLTRARLNRTKLVGAGLDGAKLDMAWGIEADLSNASLRGASLFQAQLPRARLDGADLSDARLIGTFEGGSLKGARLIRANGAPDMRNQSMGITRTSFRSAMMQGADLTDAKLAWADLEFAKLQDAVLQGTDLTLARLGGANLTGARLAGCNLTRADLASTVLLHVSGRDSVVGWEYALNVKRAFLD